MPTHCSDDILLAASSLLVIELGFLISLRTLDLDSLDPQEYKLENEDYHI